MKTNKELLFEASTRWKAALLDPYLFLTDFCTTFDPHSPEAFIRKFPKKEYIKYICRKWQEENRVSIPKSRQIMVSWSVVCLLLWENIKKPDQITFIQSKKQADAGSAHIINSLLRRMIFVIEKLPKLSGVKYKVVWTPNAVLSLGNGSTIQAVSAESESIRSSSANTVFVDEAAHIDELEAILASVLPLLSHDGKMILAGTPDSEYFTDLVFDGM
ncbi:MAG: hypothetical protein WC616_01430 [Candidatus Omnitrophota bacterium]